MVLLNILNMLQLMVIGIGIYTLDMFRLLLPLRSYTPWIWLISLPESLPTPSSSFRDVLKLYRAIKR
jgi:hypothetical protein